ncbi:hypothetical protein [Flavobacterium subsaxonicum]|uniref:Uncharacterized protein n=1 Tax=Flavobacterium subsaxonicum WB 4.1-42 = DSM 21790 TaxID=1121898 RepID=A0A0A2MKW8_9FLAO|nr:hypothetical protein [Flavobacterium subsaxonicum]KGO92191.1 hypothetical protein Q766_13595 [Flavobacterium subsaxonicum WB 4.1-42 = DSM 21790]
MDYQKILNVSESKLQLRFSDVVENIKDCIISGSTGGEIISKVGKYLKDLKFTDIEAYLVIENDIITYLKTCKENGIIII